MFKSLRTNFFSIIVVFLLSFAGRAQDSEVVEHIKQLEVVASVQSGDIMRDVYVFEVMEALAADESYNFVVKRFERAYFLKELRETRLSESQDSQERQQIVEERQQSEAEFAKITQRLQDLFTAQVQKIIFTHLLYTHFHEHNPEFNWERVLEQKQREVVQKYKQEKGLPENDGVDFMKLLASYEMTLGSWREAVKITAAANSVLYEETEAPFISPLEYRQVYTELLNSGALRQLRFTWAHVEEESQETEEKRRDSKVWFRWQDLAPAVQQQLSQLAIGETSQEFELAGKKAVVTLLEKKEQSFEGTYDGITNFLIAKRVEDLKQKLKQKYKFTIYPVAYSYFAEDL